MDPAAILAGILDRPRVITARYVLDVYGRAPGGLLANGLAFTTLFAIVPIALVTLGVAGVLVNDPTVQSQLAFAIGSLFPPVRDLVDEALRSMSEGARLTSVLGIVGLLWTVSQFYVTLDIAFSRIFTDTPERDLVRRTARGFVWVAGLMGVVVALIVGGSLAAAAEALLPTTATALIAFGDVVSSTPVVVVLGVVVVLVAYRVVPPVAPSWRAAGLPAVVAGTGIVVLSQLFLFVAPRIVSAAAVAGSLATAFIALAWLSFTFQLLLLGAAWVRVRDGGVPIATGSALAAPATPAEPGTRGQ
ncbi:MAG TPA: YihY/virulence factor BrkB family protein [Candidatus Limnocylindrales bacterium]|jgi:YihY family inner membrane protein|nr:YihY/virulence factor BrkB family protein [Candidatus Limnocylindrales bacterium]